MCAINSFTCRVKKQLFGSLVRQDIGFFETIKTGRSNPISDAFTQVIYFSHHQFLNSNYWICLSGDITSRLSTDTTLMSRAVALNVNVLLRTTIKTLGMLYLMLSLSWKLTLLMLMETPLTGLLQNIYDTHYQVRSWKLISWWMMVNHLCAFENHILYQVSMLLFRGSQKKFRTLWHKPMKLLGRRCQESGR